MSIADEKYLSFTTFRRSGERKATPIWIAELDGGRLGFTTGSDSWKLRRLRNDERCELQPSDARGRVSDDSIVVTATGREATIDELPAIQDAIKRKYGFMVTLLGLVGKIRSSLGKGESSDAGIVITLD